MQRKGSNMKTKPLTFREFYEKYRIPLTKVAEECNLNYHKVYRLLELKHMPTLRTAVLIEKYTKGEVTCEMLLPKSVRESFKKVKE